MATCTHCGATIFGGLKDSRGRRYCGKGCLTKGSGNRVADMIPDAAVEQQAGEIYQGPCPRCQGSGPVDVHESHTAMSFLVMTRWQSHVHVCCRTCARKEQGKNLAFTLFAGWWGFPWGLIMTPVQAGRNIVGMVSSSRSSGPSEKLKAVVRDSLAKTFAQSQQGSGQNGAA